MSTTTTASFSKDIQYVMFDMDGGSLIFPHACTFATHSEQLGLMIDSESVYTAVTSAYTTLTYSVSLVRLSITKIL